MVAIALVNLLEFMDSKEETSLTGFNYVSYDKTETETAVNDTNGAVNSVKTVDHNDNSIKDGGSSLNVVVDTDDETEGFASGEDEAFETANENLVVGTETLANGEEGEMFLEPSEFVVAKVDDDENDKLGFVEKKSESNSSENEIEVVKGTVRFQSDSAYGASIEVQRRELDYPIGQVQSTIGVSIIKWMGDLALGLNSLAQFSAGRNSKVTVRAWIMKTFV
ncbi:putative translocase of chloroplast, membrane anchor domain-containing protein [Helianthus anomalus]